jgi:hypothetical protein
MADGFIVRKGGAVTEQALAPTITEVSTTQTSITFTIANNDASTAVILYEVGDSTPDENSIELATGVTSDSIEITGLTGGTEYTVSATASVTGKVLSNVTSLAIETDPIRFLTFDGVDDFVEIPNLFTNKPYTITGNFRTTANTGTIVELRNFSTGDYDFVAGLYIGEPFITFPANNGELVFVTWDRSITDNETLIKTSFTVNDGDFHSFEISHDGSTMELIVDGSSIGTASNSETPFSSKSMTLGVRTRDGGQQDTFFFNGDMLDFEFYDNSTLVGKYIFSEGSGTVLGDSSGNNEDGTITGATWGQL